MLQLTLSFPSPNLMQQNLTLTTLRNMIWIFTPKQILFAKSNCTLALHLAVHGLDTDLWSISLRVFVRLPDVKKRSCQPVGSDIRVSLGICPLLALWASCRVYGTELSRSRWLTWRKQVAISTADTLNYTLNFNIWFWWFVQILNLKYKQHQTRL